MKLLRRLGLYNLNWNQIRQTWNFNRFLVVLGVRVRIADAALTTSFGERRGPGEWELSSRIYRPWHVPRGRWNSDFLPDVLVVAQHGRFGNMIRQLSLAIAVAERLGIREVLVKSLPQFPLGTWALDNGVALTHDPWLRTRMIARPRLVLGGDFFVKPRLPITVEGVNFDVIGRSLRDSLGLSTLEPQDSSTVVIHFRSGDAFHAEPHGNLGQPPFSFYEKLLSAENPARAILVYEDRANPVIAEVEAHLDARGIPYAVQSSSFEEDLTVLLSATTLVTAQGTLAEALLLLSPHVTRWIHFGKPHKPFFRSRGVGSVVSIVDSAGEYSEQILNGNWTNSDAQRSLMMSFPGDKLELIESKNS